MKIKKRKTTRLPSKLSSLILVALKDLEEVEGDERYKVKMLAWHDVYGNKCEVCLAGAVMAHLPGINRRCIYSPEIFRIRDRPAVAQKLFALDCLRRGVVSYAMKLMNLPECIAFDRRIIPYQENRDQFFADMRALAKDLKEAGL